MPGAPALRWWFMLGSHLAGCGPRKSRMCGFLFREISWAKMSRTVAGCGPGQVEQEGSHPPRHCLGTGCEHRTVSGQAAAVCRGFRTILRIQASRILQEVTHIRGLPRLPGRKQRQPRAAGADVRAGGDVQCGCRRPWPDACPGVPSWLGVESPVFRRHLW